MSKAFELNAEFRDDTGKGASRRLRRTGGVPAVVYGGRDEARAVTLQHQEFIHLLDNEAFYSSILMMRVGDVEQQVILKDLQRHPSARQVTHADFQRVMADEEITLSVPLHFIGEDDAPGVVEGGVISHMQNEVEISCLPRHLPEYLEVDVSELEMDKLLYLSDIKVPEGVSINAIGEGREDQPIAVVHRPKKEEEEVPEEEGIVPVGAAPDSSDTGEDGSDTES